MDFTTFELLEVVSPHVLRSHIAAGSITISVDMSLSVGFPTAAGHSYVLGTGTNILEEHFTVSSGLTGPDARIAALFALDEGRLYSCSSGV